AERRAVANPARADCAPSVQNALGETRSAQRQSKPGHRRLARGTSRRGCVTAAPGPFAQTTRKLEPVPQCPATHTIANSVCNDRRDTAQRPDTLLKAAGMRTEPGTKHPGMPGRY